MMIKLILVSLSATSIAAFTDPTTLLATTTRQPIMKTVPPFRSTRINFDSEPSFDGAGKHNGQMLLTEKHSLYNVQGGAEVGSTLYQRVAKECNVIDDPHNHYYYIAPECDIRGGCLVNIGTVGLYKVQGGAVVDWSQKMKL